MGAGFVKVEKVHLRPEAGHEKAARPHNTRANPDAEERNRKAVLPAAGRYVTGSPQGCIACLVHSKVLPAQKSPSVGGIRLFSGAYRRPRLLYALRA